MSELDRAPTMSIVIPAHEEGAVLGRCLRTLLRDARPGEFDVVVVANACTDDTATVARRAGVRVLETTTPGKVHALGLGDGTCSAFPRLYLDADVELDAGSVRLLAAALDRPGVLACSPRPVLDLTGVRRAAGRVHRVHSSLMDESRGLAGAGAYALGRAGHDRAFPLPDVLSDDGWVHRSFRPGERVVVDGAATVVRPASTVRAEVRRRVRVRSGNRQVGGAPHASAVRPLGPRSLWAPLRTRKVTLGDVACYLAVLAAERALSRVRGQQQVDWAADHGSRGILPTGRMVGS